MTQAYQTSPAPSLRAVFLKGALKGALHKGAFLWRIVVPEPSQWTQLGNLCVYTLNTFTDTHIHQCSVCLQTHDYI